MSQSIDLLSRICVTGRQLLPEGVVVALEQLRASNDSTLLYTEKQQYIMGTYSPQGTGSQLTPVPYSGIQSPTYALYSSLVLVRDYDEQLLLSQPQMREFTEQLLGEWLRVLRESPGAETEAMFMRRVLYQSEAARKYLGSDEGLLRFCRSALVLVLENSYKTLASAQAVCYSIVLRSALPQ